MPVFGVEQLGKPQMTLRYFDKHVIAMNTAAIVAKLIISYIHDRYPTKFFHGYIVAISMLLAAAILFISGRRFYRHIKPHDSAVIYCIPVIKNAFQTWRQYKRSASLRNQGRNNDDPNNAGSMVIGAVAPDERGSRCASTFLDFARVINHGRFSDRIVDDVKSVRTALVVCSLLIPYWLIYDQVRLTTYGSKFLARFSNFIQLNTSFPAQRQHMRSQQSSMYQTLISTSISFGDSGTIIRKFTHDISI